MVNLDNSKKVAITTNKKNLYGSFWGKTMVAFAQKG